jgi:hypothetical protein
MQQQTGGDAGASTAVARGSMRGCTLELALPRYRYKIDSKCARIHPKHQHVQGRPGISILCLQLALVLAGQQTGQLTGNNPSYSLMVKPAVRPQQALKILQALNLGFGLLGRVPLQQHTTTATLSLSK